jgi:hypothetical protein
MLAVYRQVAFETDENRVCLLGLLLRAQKKKRIAAICKEFVENFVYKASYRKLTVGASYRKLTVGARLQNGAMEAGVHVES